MSRPITNRSSNSFDVVQVKQDAIMSQELAFLCRHWMFICFSWAFHDRFKNRFVARDTLYVLLR